MSENGWAEERSEFAVPLADESMTAVDVLACPSIAGHRLHRVGRHATLGRVWPGGLLTLLETVRVEPQNTWRPSVSAIYEV
jgi:hypothetical protein